MDFKTYAQTLPKQQLPPSLEHGQVLKEIQRIEVNSFQNNGVATKGMRVFTTEGEFRTSSKVIMDTLETYFSNHKEPITNVKVVAPRGKRYLTLEGT